MAEIAIVGMGAVFPGAGDAPAFWRNICAGTDAITEVPPGRWDPGVYFRPDDGEGFYCRRGGFIDDLADFDPAQFGIMPAAVSGTEPDQLLMLRAAAEAIADSGPLPDRERIGVIIGRGGYLTPGVARLDQRVRTVPQLMAVLGDLLPGLAAEHLDAVRAAFTERLGPDQPESAIGLVPNFAASRLANRFDFGGPAYTVDAACASSLVAVDHAVRELESGRCDAVLAGGVHTCHHPTLWSVFTRLRALSAAGIIRPFDARADGTLLSEGTGAVLLKRLPDAQAAGDRVYAVIRGTGIASDGRATSMMNPRAEGQERAIRRAWAAAALDPAAPGALGLLEAHGTGTPTGDRVELATVERVFGPRGGDPIGIGTVKSMIGHAMPAAGVAGLIKAAFAVHAGVLPPTLHIGEPSPALAATRFEPVLRARPWEGTVRRAAVSAFGFGGINAHLILEAGPAPRRAPARGSGPAQPGTAREGGNGGRRGETVLRLSAPSPQGMTALLAAPDADLLRAAGAEPADERGDGPCRLALVAPDPRRLALARTVAARGTPWRGRGDLWFTPRPLLDGPEQVAFLFPGLEPGFEPRTEGVAEAFGLPAPQPPAPQPPGTGTDPGGAADIVEQALGVVAVSRLLAAALGELGIVPGALAGHSLGEWTAMIAGGVYPEIDAFIASMRPGMVEVPDVAYVALGTHVDRAAALIDGLAGMAVTHDNCPHQTVVCGPGAPAAAVLERARTAGIPAQELPFRTGFHSPMYEPYVAAARQTLRRLEVREPRVPVWSAASLAPFPRDPDAVRDLVLRHLVEPVRFRRLTELLHESGIRAFVQVGPGSLTGFTEDTLRGREHLAVATAVPQRAGLAQLRRAAAALWAEGLSPRFGLLDGTAPHQDAPHQDAPHQGAPHQGAPHQGAAPGPAVAGPVRLSLGTPFVRLTGLPLPAVVPGPAGPGRGDLPGLAALAGTAAGDPLLAEFGALLAEATQAAQAVVATLAAPAPVPAPAPTAVSPGRSPEPDGAGLVTEREFSLAAMPELADHCIFPQADDWPDVSDRFPVVPMTTLLDIMADAALALAPGFTVIGFEQARAARWLAVAPPVRTQIRATRDGGRVHVRIEGYASGTVLLAGRYPEPPPAGAPLHAERPAPVSAAELYAGRWMFHGPRFAGVAGIATLADDGITGTVLSLPARGALLDSAGQLIGHWMQVSRGTDQTVLPTGVGAVRTFGPHPPPFERLACTVWIRAVTATEMHADAELRTGDGRPWCRIEDWTTRRFATDEASWRVKFHPERNVLSRQVPGGWHVLPERWPDTASRELMMRRYLNAAERNRYQRLTPLEQRRWLLGRIAVKDAVRRRLWDRGAGPIYPAELTVDGPAEHAAGGGGDGLRVRGAFRAPPVSCALSRPGAPGPPWAVAIAADEPVSFTAGLDDQGALLITEPGRPARAISVALLPQPGAADAKGP